MLRLRFHEVRAREGELIYNYVEKREDRNGSLVYIGFALLYTSAGIGFLHFHSLPSTKEEESADLLSREERRLS